MNKMIIKHFCYECGYYGYAQTQNKKIVCPNCGTQNDWWLEGESPPENHRKE
jgi:anaerobic ribonucleoside-triphosphate reductase